MVDSCDNLNFHQTTWIDYLDGAKNPVKAVDDAIMRLNTACTQPWSHPNKNMRWLWDYLLHRKAELVSAEAREEAGGGE